MLSTCATTTRPAGVPDWDRVPFDVRCGRCGQDLRGLSDPRCPRCDLDFEWDAVLPIDDLRCLHCDYRVFGLTVRRCPECGRSFEWDKVLRGAQSRRNKLFEHLWYANPIPSLARTRWLAAFRPRRLWARYDLNDPPRIGPLLAFAALQWIVFAYAWGLVGTAADAGINELARWRDFPARFNYRFRLGHGFYQTLGSWYVTTLVSLQLLVLSKRRFGVRWPQILRVYVHATAFASLCMLLSAVLEVAVDAAVLFVPAIGGVTIRFYDRLQRGVLLAGLVVTWAHLWIGYRTYLLVPRGWGIAALCLLLGLLLACLLPWVDPLTYQAPLLGF